MKKLLTLTAMALTLAACEPTEPSAEKQQARATKQLQSDAQKQIGMPDIVNFQERRFAKMILELRDTALTTYTYFIDMNGKKHFICESVGYGLPYSVQFTNPEKIAKSYSQGGFAILPQADPNGLYMPDGLSATWVLCSSGNDVKPVYVEPQIMVSPFKMN